VKFFFSFLLGLYRPKKVKPDTFNYVPGFSRFFLLGSPFFEEFNPKNIPKFFLKSNSLKLMKLSMSTGKLLILVF